MNGILINNMDASSKKMEALQCQCIKMALRKEFQNIIVGMEFIPITNTSMVKRMGMDKFIGRTTNMKVNGKMDIEKDMDFIHGRTERNIMESLRKIRNGERDSNKREVSYTELFMRQTRSSAKVKFRKLLDVK